VCGMQTVRGTPPRLGLGIDQWSPQDQASRNPACEVETELSGAWEGKKKGKSNF